MTSGIVMLGARPSVVNSDGEADGYAPAFGKTECMLSRVKRHWEKWRRT